MDDMHASNQDTPSDPSPGASARCGCGDVPHGTPCPPPPPPPADKGCACDSCSGWRPFLWGVLVVVAVLLLWSFWSSRGDSAMARFVPAEAVLYLEANDLDAIGSALAQSPLWKEHEGGAGVREMQDKGYEHIAMALGSVRERVARDLVRHVTAFAVGYVPGDTGALTWVAVLRTENEAALLEVLRREVASEKDTARIAEQDVEHLTLFHGGDLYVLLRGRHVILTPSARQVEFLLAKRGTRAAVSDLHVIRDESVPALQVLTSVQPLVQQMDGQGILDKLPAFLPAMEPRIPLSERVNPNARLAVALRFPGRRAELQTTMIAPETVRPAGPGILSYVGWTILILLLIVVLIPVVFLISVLLLAAYFYVMAWWRGELSPSSPPAPKPLSPQAREDLGIADAAQGEPEATAPAGGQDADTTPHDAGAADESDTNDAAPDGSSKEPS